MAAATIQASAQPALSQQVAELEQEIGLKLPPSHAIVRCVAKPPPAKCCLKEHLPILRRLDELPAILKSLHRRGLPARSA